MFQDFPIRKKVLMGLIPMIVLLLAYALFSFFQLTNANNKLNVLGGYVHEQAQYGTSLFLLNNISRREQLNQQYLVTESQQTQEIMALLEKDFSLLVEEQAKHNQNNQYINRVIAKEKHYSDLIRNQLWQHKNQLSRLIAEYNGTISPELETISAGIHESGMASNNLKLVAVGSKLSLAILSARAHFNQFMSTKDAHEFGFTIQKITAAKTVLNDFTTEIKNNDPNSYDHLTHLLNQLQQTTEQAQDELSELTKKRVEAENLSNEIISGMLGAQIHQWRALDFQTKQISQFMGMHQWQSIIVLAITITVGVAILLWIARMIVNSIQALVARVSEISQGEGDLTKRIEISTKDETGALATLLNQFISSIHDIIRNAQHTASEVIDRSAQNLAHATESSQLLKEQRDKNVFIATAIDQLSQSSSEIAQSTVNSNSAVENTFQALSKGADVVERSVDASQQMQDQMQLASSVSAALAKETDEIVKFLVVIKNMTEQTNLLALNAAIEAARAGDAGRGFAVVADEVRSLATKTQASATEIEQSIENLQAESKRVVVAINECKGCAEHGAQATHDTQEIFAEVQLAVERMQEMSLSIASASEEQSKVTTKIKTDIDNVFKFSDSISRSAQASQSASKWSSDTVTQLNQVLTRFVV